VVFPVAVSKRTSERGAAAKVIKLALLVARPASIKKLPEQVEKMVLSEVPLLP
jgi:hypothetical protein